MEVGNIGTVLEVNGDLGVAFIRVNKTTQQVFWGVEEEAPDILPGEKVRITGIKVAYRKSFSGKFRVAKTAPEDAVNTKQFISGVEKVTPEPASEEAEEPAEA